MGHRRVARTRGDDDRNPSLGAWGQERDRERQELRLPSGTAPESCCTHFFAGLVQDTWPDNDHHKPPASPTMNTATLGTPVVTATCPVRLAALWPCLPNPAYASSTISSPAVCSSSPRRDGAAGPGAGAGLCRGSQRGTSGQADLLSEVELGESKGAQVGTLLADFGLQFLTELVLHDHAEVRPDLGDDLGGARGS